MRFGLQIGFGADAWSSLRDTAQAAEALGFQALYFPDHLVAEGPERQRDERPAYDPMVQTALVAEATRRVRIGHLVLCNLFRHPAVTARSLATLDELSGGRAIAGLGTGWTETEFRMTGIPFPDIGTRLRMLDEALTCVRGLWTEPSFSFTGEFYHLTDAALLPRPVQKPHPPFLLGGNGKGLLRVAARHADHVNIIAGTGREGYISLKAASAITEDAFLAKARFLREEATRAGRDGSRIEVSQTIFTLILVDDPKQAHAMTEGFAGMLGLAPEVVRRSPIFLAGTPEECATELRRRKNEWGLAETILSHRDVATLRRLGEQVLPHV